jgi:hypothetical protein
LLHASALKYGDAAVTHTFRCFVLNVACSRGSEMRVAARCAELLRDRHTKVGIRLPQRVVRCPVIAVVDRAM